MHPLVRGVMIHEEHADQLIQRMADIDIAAYQGGKVPDGGLVGIMKELEEKGVLTAEIWNICCDRTEPVEVDVDQDQRRR